MKEGISIRSLKSGYFQTEKSPPSGTGWQGILNLLHVSSRGGDDGGVLAHAGPRAGQRLTPFHGHRQALPERISFESEEPRVSGSGQNSGRRIRRKRITASRDFDHILNP